MNYDKVIEDLLEIIKFHNDAIIKLTDKVNNLVSMNERLIKHWKKSNVHKLDLDKFPKPARFTVDPWSKSRDHDDGINYEE